MSEEDFKYVKLCYDKFKQLYDECPFIGITACGSYGGFGLSDIYCQVFRKILFPNDDKVLFINII